MSHTVTTLDMQLVKLALWLTWQKLLIDVCILSWQSPIISSPSGLIHSVSLVIQPGLFLKNWDIAQEHSPEIHNHITNFVNGLV